MLVDIYDVESVTKFVDIDRAEEVICHHLGMKQFWREKIGEQSEGLSGENTIRGSK